MTTTPKNTIRVLHLPANIASLISHNCEGLKAAGICVRGSAAFKYKDIAIQEKKNILFLDWNYPPLNPEYPVFPSLPSKAEDVSFIKNLKFYIRYFLAMSKRLILLLTQFPLRIRIFIKRYVSVLNSEEKALSGPKRLIIAYRHHRTRRKTTRECMTLLKWANYFHWYTEWGISYDFLKYIQKKNAPGVIEWQGSEIRIPEIEFQTNPYYALLLDENKQSIHGNYPNSVYAQRYFGQLNFTPLVTGGMFQYVLPEYREKAKLIFHPLPLPLFEDVAFPSITKKRPVVVHAPSHKKGKGTKYIEQAVAKLRNLVDFDYVEIHDMKREEAQKVIASCDVFIDQLIVGDHGMASLEAMSYGKPVVCYLKETVKENLPAEIPIINACPDNITSRLYSLLKSPENRYSVGVASRKYVEKYHDPKVTTEKLIGIYNELLG